MNPLIDLGKIANISDSLRLAAGLFPDSIAVAQPTRQRQRRPLDYRTITFRELNERADRIAGGLVQAGVTDQMRISLMIPPGIEFVAWVFGVLRSRAVVILIDPGMGRKNMIRCLAEARPDGLCGILPAQIARTVFRSRLPDCRYNFLVGRGVWFGTRSTRPFFAGPAPSTVTPAGTAEDPAAIIFTTGSTGPAKGVLYRHRHFIQQTVQIRDYFGIEPGGTDVSGFPLFALFNTGMGMTTVFPRMDATRPANVDPLDIADAVNHFSANQAFGSPALWNTVATFAAKNPFSLPTVQRVLTAGAPVPARVLEGIRKIIGPGGQVHTPYGATESLPVACIESDQVLNETAEKTRSGAGTCVGRRWPQIRWRVIEISDDPIADISQTNELAAGKIGELIVSGPVVTDQYVTRTDANALHKIRDGDTFWHRMGDVGYLDDQDRFWFCGRKSHRVICGDRTLFTDCCEAIFNQHQAIFRSALVGIGPRNSQTPVIVVEPFPEFWPVRQSGQQSLRNELLELGAANELTNTIRNVLFMRKLPTDIRHNSKIFREQIAVWAAKRLSR